MKKRAPTTLKVYLFPELRKKIEAAAKEDRRSLSAEIVVLILEALETRSKGEAA